jgi:hypothetical protein
MGFTCVMVVSRSVFAATKLPSDFAARLVMPPIGALTFVYERLS